MILPVYPNILLKRLERNSFITPGALGESPEVNTQSNAKKNN